MVLVIFAARCAAARIFSRALSRVGFVLVPQAHAGVVEDRHQHVVELVRRRADQLAERRQLLRLGKLLLERGDLFFGGGRWCLGGVRHG